MRMHACLYAAAHSEVSFVASLSARSLRVKIGVCKNEIKLDILDRSAEYPASRASRLDVEAINGRQQERNRGGTPSTVGHRLSFSNSAGVSGISVLDRARYRAGAECVHAHITSARSRQPL